MRVAILSIFLRLFCAPAHSWWFDEAWQLQILLFSASSHPVDSQSGELLSSRVYTMSTINRYLNGIR